MKFIFIETGPEGLKAMLRADGLRFVRSLTDRLLTYTLGRGLERADRTAVEGIAQRVEQNGERFSALVLGIVESQPVQMRRPEGHDAVVTIALPWLEAMEPLSATGTAKAPVRMMHVYAPSGMMPQYWDPTTTGADFEYRRVMKPLEKFRKDILVLSGLSAAPLGLPLADGGGDHARAVGAYLTGVRIKKTLGAQTRFGSLELTCEDSRSVGDCDSYTCAYGEFGWEARFSRQRLRPLAAPGPVSLD